VRYVENAKEPVDGVKPKRDQGDEYAPHQAVHDLEGQGLPIHSYPLEWTDAEWAEERDGRMPGSSNRDVPACSLRGLDTPQRPVPADGLPA